MRQAFYVIVIKLPIYEQPLKLGVLSTSGHYFALVLSKIKLCAD